MNSFSNNLNFYVILFTRMANDESLVTTSMKLIPPRCMCFVLYYNITLIRSVCVPPIVILLAFFYLHHHFLLEKISFFYVYLFIYRMRTNLIWKSKNTPNFHINCNVICLSLFHTEIDFHSINQMTIVGKIQCDTICRSIHIFEKATKHHKALATYGLYQRETRRPIYLHGNMYVLSHLI